LYLTNLALYRIDTPFIFSDLLESENTERENYLLMLAFPAN
jgi:hypothetical protein